MAESPTSVAAFSDGDESTGVAPTIAARDIPASVALAEFSAKAGEYVRATPPVTVAVTHTGDKPVDIFPAEESADFHSNGADYAPETQQIVGKWTSPASGKRREMARTQRGALIAKGDPDDPEWMFAPMLAKHDLKYTKAQLCDLMGDEAAQSIDFKRDLKNADLLSVVRDIDARDAIKSSDLREALKLLHVASGGYIVGTDTVLALEKSVRQSARRKASAKGGGAKPTEPAGGPTPPCSQESVSLKRPADDGDAEPEAKRPAVDPSMGALFNDAPAAAPKSASRRKQSNPKRSAPARRARAEPKSDPVVVDDPPVAAGGAGGFSFTLTAANVSAGVAQRLIRALGSADPE